jgi:CMP-N-acetylneuraminic acid synthetase/spore coat polysaccharide biosynthesis predicted glycosyltransferase SpsG
MMNVLVVIPARGGSKGIPRKNLRSLNGMPLIYYSIRNALQSEFKPDVYVTSEDDEILSIARKFGAKAHERAKDIADDKTTLDPVIFDVFQKVSSDAKKNYDLVVTLQPTSPLLKSSTLDEAIRKMMGDPAIDTIISAINDTHLTWRHEEGRYRPNFEKRVNRQYLTPVFKETGGFLITRAKCMSPQGRIGKHTELFQISKGEAIDIDSFEDWSLCEYYLKRRKILFVVSGYPEIGLGHVYNALILANEILTHEVSFLVDGKSELARSVIARSNYTVMMQEKDSLVDDVIALQPEIVINDILDTSEAYVTRLKQAGIKVVNFEDLGEGSKHADLVINAMYPEKEMLARHYFGPGFFCIRNEFMVSQRKVVEKRVKSVLLTFGGVDPGNFTEKVLAAILPYCEKNGISIEILAGMGYSKYGTLEKYRGVNIHRNVPNISDFMLAADIIFTSAGRTTFEIAAIGTPAIVLAQNTREMTHFFATQNHGFINLGLGVEVPGEKIASVFRGLVESHETRKQMSDVMLATDVKAGRAQVLKLINDLVEGKS